MTRRLSVLALGQVASTVGDWSGVVVKLAAVYTGAKLNYTVEITGLPGGSALVADSAGRVRGFKDMGAALAKLRAALEPAGDLLRVEVQYSNMRPVSIASDLADSALKRSAVLEKLSIAARAEQAEGVAFLAAISPGGVIPSWGVEKERYDEVSARAASLVLDIAEIDRQVAALPAISLRPDA